MFESNHLQSFNDLCIEKSNENKIVNLFSQKDELSSDILVSGCIKAIEHQQSQYIPIILDYINDKKITLEGIDTRIIYNCAIHFNNLELLEMLDSKLAVIESLKEDKYVRVGRNGKVELIGDNSNNNPISSLPNKNTKEHYIGNPLLFSLTNFNIDALEYILKKATEIHPTVIENAFIETIVTNNHNAVFYLTENKKTRNIIKESKIINLFLKENTEYIEMKKKVLALLEVMMLKDELEINSSNNNVVERKLKI